MSLEAHLAQLPPFPAPGVAPADEQAYLVLADHLQAQGDPWGELIALQYHAALDAERREELELEAQILLEQHGRTILGGLAVDPVWHHGFLRRATVRTTIDAVEILASAKAALRLPVACRLEALALAPRPDRFDTQSDWGASEANIVDPWPDWDDLGPVLWDRATGATRVPELGFGGWPAHPADAYVRMPSWNTISRWFRDLHGLTLVGSARQHPEPLDLPALETLEVRFADARTDDLDALAASRLPRLARITVSLGGSARCILDDAYPPHVDHGYPDAYDDDDLASLSVPAVGQDLTVEALERFLERLPPSVTDLGFSSSRLLPELLMAIVEHPRVGQLARLDLSACSITDQTITYVLDRAPVLARIGSLDLSRNDLSSRYVSRIRRALPNAQLGVQGQRHPDFFMRYVATVE